MRTLRAATLLAIGASLAAIAPQARGDVQSGVPEVFPSRHELSGQLGFQLGFGGKVGDPSGLKLTAEYGYRFHPIVWFDVQLSQLFGAGGRNGVCMDNPALLCYRGGWMTQLAAGVKLKIALKAMPLVVEVPILVGVGGMYNRDCNDDGAAIPFGRAGVGAKYFLTRRIGVGAHVDFDAGPAFHQATACRAGGGYTDFYGAFDFMLGAEFIL